MRVTAGDLLVVKGQHAGQPDVHVEVLETRGVNGTPPWLVHWGEDGHEGVLYPGPGATIEYTEGCRLAHAALRC